MIDGEYFYGPGMFFSSYGCDSFMSTDVMLAGVKQKGLHQFFYPPQDSQLMGFEREGWGVSVRTDPVNLTEARAAHLVKQAKKRKTREEFGMFFCHLLYGATLTYSMMLPQRNLSGGKRKKQHVRNFLLVILSHTY